FVFGDLEVEHQYGLAILPRSRQLRLVDHVGQVCAGKSWSTARQHLKIHILGQRNLAGMHAQNFFAPAHIRTAHYDSPVKATGAQQRRIQHVRTVRRGHQNDAFVRFEPVHLHQQLIQGLLALVMATTQAGSAVPSHGIDLVDKDDAGSILLTLFEQITHPAPAEPEIEKNGTLASPATARARSVLPVPGGPTNSTPLGILPPSFWNFCASRRNSIISRSSSLASSTPATSLKVTFFCCIESNRARLFPNDSALLPPVSICRIMKNHSAPSRISGAQVPSSCSGQLPLLASRNVMETPLSRSALIISGQ